MKKRQRKLGMILSLTLLSLLILGACGSNTDTNEIRQEPPEVKQSDVIPHVTGDGNLSLRQQRQLTFGIIGRVAEINVDEGDRVYKGDVLAKLDTRDIELGILKAEDALETDKRTLKDTRDPYDEVDKAVAASTLAAAESGLSGAYEAWAIDQTSTAKWSAVKSAEATLERARETWDDIVEGFDAEDVADAERQVAIAEATLDDAKRQLEEATIFAPFSGIVAEVFLDKGDYITSAATVAIHLIDISHMELTAEVDELDIPMVKLGQKAIINVDALPDVHIEGEVIFISPLATKEAGVVMGKVKIAFDAPEEYALKAGMSASTDIIID
ncbi:HlyD family secretion protein [Chloroflexota bacterium]